MSVIELMGLMGLLFQFSIFHFSPLERPAIQNGTAKGNLVGVLQLVVLSHTTGQSRHAHSCISQFAVDVEASSVSLHGGTEGKDDLLDFWLARTLHERRDFEILWAYAVYRRDNAAEHMINAAILLRGLDGHDILYTFYHTEGSVVAAGVGTDAALLLIGNVVAVHIVSYVLGQFMKDGGKRFDVTALPS